MRKVLRYMSAYKGTVAAGLVLKIIGTIAELVLPLIMAYMIDEIAPSKDVLALSLWGAAMLVFAIIAWAGNVTGNRLASRVARDTTERLRNDLFCATMGLSAAQCDDVTVPSLVSRLSSDTYNVHNMIGMMQRLGIRVPVLLIGGIALTFAVDAYLALVLLAVVPFLVVIVAYVSSKGIVLYTDLQRAVDSMVRKVRDDYTGIRVIKALSKTDYESASFDGINDNVVKKEKRAGIMMSVSNPVMNAVLNLGMTAVIAVGAYRVSIGQALVGEIIAFTSYFTIILNAVIMISRLFVMLSKGNASANRIAEVLDKPADLIVIQEEEEQEGQEEPKEKGIRFDNVSFCYGDAPALKNISFFLPEGRTLGIIGATGSGKTTLVSLLMRFYDVGEGKITIDGKDVRSYPKEELCAKFGVVLQNDFLMAATVEENIDFERNLDAAEIKKAAQNAKAAQFIEALSDGYEGMLAVRGANFSGGQKQRLLIARALAGKPDILILDDSSSALDYKTDAELRKTLREQYPDSTVITVAQRISSVRYADMILVLDKGCQAGLGTDSELLRDCEVYRDIYQSQVH